MKSLLILFVLLTCAAPCIYGLSCVPCYMRNCTEPNCERSGKALDICGCCNVCAKQVGQPCRGIWNTLGTCDRNLTCGFKKEQIEIDRFFPQGLCSDAHCKAIVDIVIALDGSDSITETNFDILKQWIFVVIRMLYERFGACAHIGLLEYAGSSTENFISPFGLGVCTNNEDCYGERLKNLTRLDMDGAYTYQALLAIAKDHLDTSNRTERSEKIIFVVTDEMPVLTSTEVEEWKNITSAFMINTYALGVGIPDENGIPPPALDLNGVLSGSGSAWNVPFPPGNDTLLDLVDSLWNATVKIPVTCKYPEEYSPCKSTSCAPTCDDPSALCPLECAEKACVCSEGYVRLSEINDTCVKYADCPQNQCSYPEVYRSCSKVCNATCDEPDPICIEKCGPPKCQCADGYVWKSDEDMTCIHRNSCPNPECPDGVQMFCFANGCDVKKCPAFPEAECRTRCNGCIAEFYDNEGNNVTEKCCPSNEVFRDCSSPCTATCNNPNPICPAVCAPPKCECEHGYVRRSLEDRTCIPVEKCSGDGVQCDFPEVYRQCSSACTATCNNPSPTCIEMCFPPKCECETGYVRRSPEDMTCIRLEECPAVQECDGTKVYEFCPPMCHPTCDDPNPNCPPGCGTDHCVCPTDHVLYSVMDRRCVHSYQCPDRKCVRQCPQIDMTSAGACANRRSAEAWLCHLSNWKCTTYEWKLSMEQWWYTSGCYAVAGQIEERWRALFLCGEYIPAQCSNPRASRYETDAFGCGISYCDDGNYRDFTQPLLIWKNIFATHQEMLQLYQEAVKLCSENSGGGGGGEC